MSSLYWIWLILKFCVGLGIILGAAYVALALIGLVISIPIFIASGVYGIAIAIVAAVYCEVRRALRSLWKWVAGSFAATSDDDASRRSRTKTGNRNGNRSRSHSANQFDPYDVLSISRKANASEIKSAYFQQMSQYHPDKVAHLGIELRTLAEEKAKSIQKAYTLLATR